VAAGRLTLPFSGNDMQSRRYHAYVPEARAEDPAVRAFCDWLPTAA
ncbi:transcriptional regulator, partial [Methylobacterium sp. WL103]